MKIRSIITALLLTALPTLADFRTWTNSEGQTADLELRGVEEVGLFGLKGGWSACLNISQPCEQDAKSLEACKAAEPAKPAKETVFGRVLDGNLVVLTDGCLKDIKDHKTPEKYYVFYYTASWCPPCRTFTPTLVSWYNKNKNDNFELVLISSDRDKDAMLNYAKDKKMPWPQLALDESGKFKAAHDHGVRGIPSLIVCDLNGRNYGNFRGRLDELTEMVK
ncbi:MAG: thioredoxin-like domain-containing protein [Luteolibacter sp.]